MCSSDLVVSRVLMRVSGAVYPPRFERLERLLAALREPGSAARTLLGCRIGKAPKARAEFGPATLEIVPEKPRRTGASAMKRRKVSRPPSKSPQKGRNVGLTFNS